MSVTYGFYNSKGGDRKYDAMQLSSIFDGIIEDGIYKTYGDAMVVKPGTEDNQFIIGTGRAWFDHTWTLNSSPLPMKVPVSDAIRNRIDVVVLEVNKSESVRANSFKLLVGDPAEEPVPKPLVNTRDIKQYALAHISRPAKSTKITQSHITNKVGTSETPFVIGVLKTLTIDFIVEQWKSQWNDWYTKTRTDSEKKIQDMTNTLSSEIELWRDWLNSEKSKADNHVTGVLADMDKSLEDFQEWINQEQISKNAQLNSIISSFEANTASQTEDFKDRLAGIISDSLISFGEFEESLNSYDKSAKNKHDVFSDWLESTKESKTTEIEQLVQRLTNLTEDITVYIDQFKRDASDEMDQLFEGFKSEITELKGEFSTDFTTFTQGLRSEWDSWFNTIKEELEGFEVGEVLNKLEDYGSRIDAMEGIVSENLGQVEASLEELTNSFNLELENLNSMIGNNTQEISKLRTDAMRWRDNNGSAIALNTKGINDLTSRVEPLEEWNQSVGVYVESGVDNLYHRMQTVEDRIQMIEEDLSGVSDTLGVIVNGE